MEVATGQVPNNISPSNSDSSLSTDNSEGLLKKDIAPKLNNQGKEAIVLFYKILSKPHREERDPKFILSDFITDGGIKQRQDKYKDSRNFLKKNIKGQLRNTFMPQPVMITEESLNKNNKTFTASLSQRKQIESIKKTEKKSLEHSNYKGLHTNTNDDEQLMRIKKMKAYIAPQPKKKKYCLTEENINDKSAMNRKGLREGKLQDKENDQSPSEKKQRTIEELTEKNKVIAMHNVQIQLANEQSKKLALLEKKIEKLTQHDIDIDSDVKEIEEEPNEFTSEQKGKENGDDLNVRYDNDDNFYQNESKKSEEQGPSNKSSKTNQRSKKVIEKDNTIKSSLSQQSKGNASMQHPSIQTSEYLKEIFKFLPSKYSQSSTEPVRINPITQSATENEPNAFKESKSNSTKPKTYRKDNTALIFDEEYGLITKRNKKPLKTEEEFNLLMNENLRKEKEAKAKQEEAERKKTLSLYEKLMTLLSDKQLRKKPIKKKLVKNEYYQGRHRKKSSSISTQLDQTEYLNTITQTKRILSTTLCLTESNGEGWISKEAYDQFLNENEEKTKRGQIGISPEKREEIISIGKSKEEIKTMPSTVCNDTKEENSNGVSTEKVYKTIEKTNEIFSKLKLDSLLGQGEKKKNESNEKHQDKKDNQPSEKSNPSLNSFHSSQSSKNDNKNHSVKIPNVINNDQSTPLAKDKPCGKLKSHKISGEKSNSLEAFIITAAHQNSKVIGKSICGLFLFMTRKRSLCKSIILIDTILTLQLKRRFNQYCLSISKTIIEDKQHKQIESLTYSEDSREVYSQETKRKELQSDIDTLFKCFDNVFIKPIKSAILQRLCDFAYEEHNLRESPVKSKDYSTPDNEKKSKEEGGVNVSASGQNHTYLYESFEDKQSVLLYPNSEGSDRLHRLCELFKKHRESMGNESSPNDSSIHSNHINRTMQSCLRQDLSTPSCSQLSIGAYSSKSKRSLMEIIPMRPKKIFKKHLDEIISPSTQINVLAKGLSSSDKEMTSMSKISNSSVGNRHFERKESNEGDISADKDISSGIDWEYTISNRNSIKDGERFTSGKVSREPQPMILEELNDVGSHNRELSLENKINAIEIKHGKEEEVPFHTNDYEDELEEDDYGHNRNEANRELNRKKEDLFVFILEEEGRSDGNIFIDGAETITQGLIRNKQNAPLGQKDSPGRVNNRYDNTEYEIQIDKNYQKPEQEGILITIEQPKLPMDYSILSQMTELHVNGLVDDIVSSILQKEISTANLPLLPKKRVLSKKELEIQISQNSSFGSSPSSPKRRGHPREEDFSSSQSITSYCNSSLMKTVHDIKTEVCLNIYNKTIAPLLIREISLQIGKNYTRIFNQINRPIIHNAELLMNGIQLKEDKMISESQGDIPYSSIPFISKDFLIEFNEVNQQKRNEENVINDNYNDHLMNELVVDAANEIIEKERRYGEVGAPLPWSIRSREVEYKYKNDPFSCHKLQELVIKKLERMISFKMGLIAENHEHFNMDQLTQDRESKFLRSITEELSEEEPVWKGLEKEETEVKSILNRILMEQLLNEIVEILEHVQLSRKEPSIYQYKSIYSCEDIPRLSFQNNNYNEGSTLNQNTGEDSAYQNTGEDSVNQ